MATRTKPYTSSLAETRPRSFFTSSVGTKVVVGITGLLLCLYLVLHLAGNLLIFLGPATFNGYSHALIANPLLIPVEIGLLAIFVLHVYKAVTNWLANRRARPVAYYRKRWAGRPSRKSIASSTMIVSGVIVLAFVVVHLKQFRFGPEYVVQTAPPGAGAVGEVRDLYRLETEVFGNVLNVAMYTLCMVVVGSHLWHGFSSAFSSLGAEHPRYTPWILRAGRVFAVVLGVGFLCIPVWVFWYGSSG